MNSEAEWAYANAQDERDIKVRKSLEKAVGKYDGALRRLATTDVKVKRLSPDAVVPTKAHADDAGFDLYAAADVVIEPGETVIVPTGLAFELPLGYEMQIRPRSGVTVKTKLRVQLGTIDANYRGEVGVIVDNIAHPYDHTVCHMYGLNGGIDHESGDSAELIRANTFVIRKHDRLAQAVITRLPAVQLTEVDELGVSERGEGGFGSSGVGADNGREVL